MRRLVFVLPVGLFAALVFYFVLALGPGRDPQALPSVLIDQPAPAFALAGLDGGSGLGRDQLGGQVALVNFFASWCVPCRAEHPVLMRLSEQEHVPIYGIAYKDKPEDCQRFLGQLGDPYRRIGLDRDGRVGIDWGVYGVPETFLLDKAGRIRYRHVGPLSAEAIDKELLPLIRQLNRS